jgi:hypothetical protein
LLDLFLKYAPNFTTTLECCVAYWRTTVATKSDFGWIPELGHRAALQHMHGMEIEDPERSGLLRPFARLTKK